MEKGRTEEGIRQATDWVREWEPNPVEEAMPFRIFTEYKAKPVPKPDAQQQSQITHYF